MILNVQRPTPVSQIILVYYSVYLFVKASTAPSTQCYAANHRAQCQCNPGYTGNPNDHTGCRPVPLGCRPIPLGCQSDKECSETHKCQKQGSINNCLPVCDSVNCGPGAVCVANDHVGQCQCPAGLFTVDAYDLVNGCSSVKCLVNNDCPTDKLCEYIPPYAFTCRDVCADPGACGENAICVAENHKEEYCYFADLCPCNHYVPSL